MFKCLMQKFWKFNSLSVMTVNAIPITIVQRFSTFFISLADLGAKLSTAGVAGHVPHMALKETVLN